MQNIHWILQKNLIKETDLQEIKTALLANDVSFEEVKVIPFSDNLPPIKGGDVAMQHLYPIFYGSTTLILNAYENETFSKGIFYDKASFNMKNYFEKWGNHMLNFDSEVLTFSEIVKKGYNEGNWFVRPIYDDKAFSGKVMSIQEIINLEKSLATSNNPYLNENTLVVISKPKTIIKEWRHFIVNKEIVSSSKYAEYGRLNKSRYDVPDDLLKFVENRCNEYIPNSIFVMDTALCDNEYKIVECNCFNDTGFYDHDIKEIIQAVNRYIKAIIQPS